MADCYDKLSASILLTCGNKLQAGLADRLIIINYDDVDKDMSTVNATNDKIVESIVFKSASPDYAAYAIEGFKYSNGLEIAYAPGRFSIAWEPKITARIFDNDPDVKERVQELVNSKVMIIAENNYNNTTGNSVFEIYGFDAGLEVKAVTRNVEDAEMKGGWVIEFGANETSKPHYPAYTFFKTDLATTRAAVDALL